MIENIHYELKRLQAADVKVEMDEQFEPQAGTLAKITYAGALWHVVPAELLDLLKELPDGAGGEAIKKHIETNANLVWHGPAPESRDTSP